MNVLLALGLSGILLWLGFDTTSQMPLATPTDSAMWATIEAAPEVFYPPCDPVVENIVWGEVPDEDVSVRLGELYIEDQSARTVETIDWNEVARLDQEHQVEVMGYLQAGQVVTAFDLYYAAMIFQHGDCPEHYLLTQELTQRAINKGSGMARWLYAAATDRYLMSLGQPQLYGTQARCYPETGCFLWPVDPAITDEDRADYNVPPLAERIAEIEAMNTP
jgi:hypothetical protein